MSTDFSKPIVTDAYATLLPGVVAAHLDLARQLEPTLTGTSTNVPTGAVRWNASTIRWERYNGASWVTLPSAGDNVYAISISGNAATATKLATSRTIGGVAFDGTANINLPGVNAAGNQNTTGNAATASNGVGQTWQILNSIDRSIGTNYTNSTGKTIVAYVTVYVASSVHAYANINGSGSGSTAFGGTDFMSSSGMYATHILIVPNGHTYAVSNGSWIGWMELR